MNELTSEQKSELMGITDAIQLIINQLTTFSQSYTLDIAEIFRLSYYTGASAGVRAAVLDVPGNATLKQLRAGNQTLVYAYENGYTFGRIIANALIAGQEMTTSLALTKLKTHCGEVFSDRYGCEIWG